MPDEIMCRAFPTTLKRSARVWFNKLKPGTIETIEELSRHFVGHFIAGQWHRKPTTYLLTVKQQKGEYHDCEKGKKKRDDKKADKKRPTLTTKDEKETKYKKPMVNQNERTSRYRSTKRYANYVPLNMPIDQVFLQIQDEPYLKWPPKLKSDPMRRPRDKYCRFHKDHRHATEDYFDLKDQVENLIRMGHMRRFTVGNDRNDTNLPRAG
ncbi:uncharacterized protein LOC132272469 [Cornus florida]|uniref:uncharacterized protein LOC132272469 n=1 Tax=Cornus florida TaxID=4283 RepID=UPI002898915A|nr:uncharacterized protein LOC132272469 [Cornus florida]